MNLSLKLQDPYVNFTGRMYIDKHGNAYIYMHSVMCVCKGGIF
jgi:hypothetical protein